MKPRTMAIGVTALVVAAGLIAILVSSDSSDSSPAPVPSLAEVTQPALTVSSGVAGAQAAPADARSTKGQKSPGAQGQSSSTALPAGPSCPPDWSKQLCRQVGQAHKRGLGKSHEVKDGQCPLPTKQMCDDAGRAVKQGKDASHEVGPNECPLPTQAMCEEAGRQNQQAGVNPFN